MNTVTDTEAPQAIPTTTSNTLMDGMTAWPKHCKVEGPRCYPWPDFLILMRTKSVSDINLLFLMNPFRSLVDTQSYFLAMFSRAAVPLWHSHMLALSRLFEQTLDAAISRSVKPASAFETPQKWTKVWEGLDKIDVMKARCTHICGLCSLAMFAAIVLFPLHGRDYESPATSMGWTSF